jgi:hypothetical protein
LLLFRQVGMAGAKVISALTFFIAKRRQRSFLGLSLIVCRMAR